MSDAAPAVAVFAPDVPSLWAALVDDLRALKRAEPLARVTVVVPGKALVEWCRFELGRAAQGTWLGVDVVPLYALAARVTPDFDAREAPDEVLRLLLASRPLPEWIAAFDEPEAALLATFHDLDDAGFDPSHLEPAQELVGAGSRTAQLLQTLVGLRESLEGYGLATRADRLRAAAERMGRGQGPALSRLLIYGLYDVTGGMAELLQALLRTADGPRIYLPAVPDSGDALESADTAGAYLRRVFDSFVLPAVGRVEHRPSVAAPPALRVVDVSGVRGELDTVARELREALLAGVPAESLAVVGREIQSLLPIARQTFARLGVPLRAGRPLPGRAYGLLRGLLSLLTLVEQGLQRAPLFDALRNGGRAVRLRLAGFVSLFEAAVARVGANEGEALSRLGQQLVAGATLVEPRAVRDAEDEAPAAMHAEATRALGGVIVAVAETLAGWPEEAPVATHLARWALLVRAVVGPPGEDHQRALDHVAKGLERAPIDVGRAAFARAAARLLDGLDLAPAQGHGVRLLDVMAARGMRFERLWLIGLDRRRWPRSIREDPLLPDAVRRRLAQDLGLEALPVKERGYAEERLLFDHALGSAVASLTLVHQRSDDEGKAVAVSPFVEAAIAGRPVSRATTPRRAADTLRGLAEAQRYGGLLPRDLGLLAATSLGLEAVDTLLRVSPASRRPGLAAALIAAQQRDRLGVNPGARDGLVARGLGRDLLLAPLLSRPVAPTRVEALLACPWRFFVERVLRLGATDSGLGLPEPDPILVGNVTHAVHERLVDWLRAVDSADDLTWDDARAIARAAARKELVVAAHAEDGGVGPRLAVALAAPEIGVRVEGLVDMLRGRFAVAGPRPEQTEVDRSAQLTLPSGRQVTIEARVDRIDVGPDGRRRYADLKTGRAEKGELIEAVRRGKRLQVPFYTWLAEAEAQEPSWVGFEFLPGSGGHEVVGADVLDQGRLSDAGKRVLDLALRLLEGGVFPLRRSSACAFCDVTATCLRAHRPATRRLERLGQDEPLEHSGELIRAYYRLAEVGVELPSVVGAG